MIRIICADTDYSSAANVGGPVDTRHRTFDIDAPEVEAFLKGSGKWNSRSFVGIEVVEQPAQRREGEANG